MRDLLGPRPLAVLVIGTALAATAGFAWSTLTGIGEPSGAPDPRWLYGAVVALAAASCLGRGAFVADGRSAWLALGIGFGLAAASEIYSVAALVGRPPPTAPSIADFLYLSAYPAYCVGILLLARRCGPEPSLSQWLDGAIGALASAAFWSALHLPWLTGLGGSDPGAMAVDLAYPLADLLLLMVLVGALAAGGSRLRGEWAVVVAGMLLIAVADGLRLYGGEIADDGGPAGALVLWGIALVVLAAWRRPAEEERVVAIPALILPSLFAILAASLQVSDLVRELDPIAAALSAATLVVVVARMIATLGEKERLLGAVRREAVTDPLTGLGNRRAFLRDLERALRPREPTARLAMFDLDGFKSYNDTFGHAAGDLLLKRLAAELGRAIGLHGSTYRLGGDEFCVLLPDRRNGDPAALLAEASAALYEEGEGFAIGSSNGVVLLPDEAHEVSAALRLADERLYADKGHSSRPAQKQAHDVLMGLLHEREPVLSEHARGVRELAVGLAWALGVSNEKIDVIARAAELHDIGKVAIPDRILHKTDPLTPEEEELIREHPLIGQRILSAAPAMDPVARLVRSTHERWDGRGYPDGLAGSAIPLGSRIISISDAYEAMTAERPYSRARSVSEAVDELRREAATQFDAHLVELFCERLAALNRDGAAPELRPRGPTGPTEPGTWSNIRV